VTGTETRRARDLGEFLRTRRARLTPDDVGLTSYGARRVPGLRREELAMLAGVSVTYYTRLEQGQSVNASDSVIEALARALCLDTDERAHLRDLARPTPPKRWRTPPPVSVRTRTRTLIDAMGDVPAVLMGRSSEVLAWNRLGHSLVAGHVPFDAPFDEANRPNLTRMLFLDPHTRALYADWREEAARAVASLRLVAGRFQEDRDLAELIGELSIASDEFARLWAGHPVANCISGTKRISHPEVGELELGFEVLQLPDGAGHRLLTYTAEPDTPARHTLDLLARLSAS
jgi:transcriptional regulator with XRE-family HTH domain